MANLAGSYDQNAEPGGDFDPIPAGKYRAVIVESDVEDISRQSNKGRCLKLTWKVDGGQYDGRLIWQRLNLWPENMNNMDKVVQIANAQFASIRQATGKIAVQDSEELHHIPCMIGVKIRKSEGYSDQNEVSSVAAAGGSAPANTAQPAQQRQAPPASNGGGSRPWNAPAA